MSFRKILFVYLVFLINITSSIKSEEGYNQCISIQGEYSQAQSQENSEKKSRHEWKPLALASTLFLTTVATIVLVAQSDK